VVVVNDNLTLVALALVIMIGPGVIEVLGEVAAWIKRR